MLIRIDGSFFLRHKKIFIPMVCLLVMLAGSTLSVVLNTKKSNVLEATTAAAPVETDTTFPLSTGESLKTLGILMLGYGGAGHDGGYLTDAMQVAFVDFAKSKITLISIPRDLSVQLPNGRSVKINAVLTSLADKKGNELIVSGGTQLKSVVATITGLPINYFIGVDFVGFQKAIGENLHGIEVSVGETLDDPWYPIKGKELETCGKTPEEMGELSQKYSGFELERQYECRYKHLLYKPGLTIMQGGEALEYARSRHGSSEGDVSRGKRQQEVLTGVKNKLFSLSALDKLPMFYDAVAKNVTTDISLDIVKYLGPFLKTSQNFQVTHINLGPANVLVSSQSSTNGYIMIPKSGSNNWDEIHAFIKQTLEQ